MGKRFAHEVLSVYMHHNPVARSGILPSHYTGNISVMLRFRRIHYVIARDRSDIHGVKGVSIQRHIFVLDSYRFVARHIMAHHHDLHVIVALTQRMAW